MNYDQASINSASASMVVLLSVWWSICSPYQNLPILDKPVMGVASCAPRSVGVPGGIHEEF